MRCLSCNSNEVKVRKNFSHGSSSKSKTSYSCKICGSTNIEKIDPKKKFFRKRV